MSYEAMTVAQLRAVAEERGVELGKGWKKARIVSALEEGDAGAQSVEAEVIDEPQGLAVSLLPGTLHADFAALDARIDGILAQYEGWEPSPDDADELKHVARERKYLNGLANELDERRKEIKREYTRPLAELEGMVNARRDRIKAVVARLQAVEKEAEAARREAKESELREHYEAVAGLLADIVPYGAIADPRWMNKQPAVEKCKLELEERCRRVAADWETLKAQEGTLPRYDAAERAFFATLDLGAALNAAREAHEADERIAGMRAEMAEYGHGEVPPDTEPETAPEPTPEPEPAPQAAPAPEPAPSPAPQAAAPVAVPGGRYVPCVMVIQAASIEQMQEIGRFCGDLIPRVTGRFVTGTLEQAFEKERRQIGGFND